MCLMAIALAVTMGAFAQTVAVAQLSGTVVDDSGGALPGVEVTVKQTGHRNDAVRGVRVGRRAPSSQTCLLVPTPSRPNSRGFTSFEQSGIVLAVGDSRSLKVTLKVGAVSETITVVGNTSQVETRSTGVGLVVSQEQIVGLPLNGRQPTSLVALSGGAVDTSNVGGLTSNRQYRRTRSRFQSPAAPATARCFLSTAATTTTPATTPATRCRSRTRCRSSAPRPGVRPARYGMYYRRDGERRHALRRQPVPRNSIRLCPSSCIQRDSVFQSDGAQWSGQDDGLKRHQAGGTIGGPIDEGQIVLLRWGADHEPGDFAADEPIRSCRRRKSCAATSAR